MSLLNGIVPRIEKLAQVLLSAVKLRVKKTSSCISPVQLHVGQIRTLLPIRHLPNINQQSVTLLIHLQIN